MPPDHYAVLGVDRSARAADIRAAYRRLMREHHPDLRPGDPSAEEIARRLTAAWGVLGRPSSRAAYDRTLAPRRPVAGVGQRTADLRPAYSPDGTDYRRAFHLASRKAASLVLLLGIVVLLVLSR